jgi:hypothetical protein
MRMFPEIYIEERPGVRYRDRQAELQAWVAQKSQGTKFLVLKHCGMVDAFEWPLINDPNTDLAIISWIFWRHGLAWHLDNPMVHSAEINAILGNLRQGHYPRAELSYDRRERVDQVRAFAKALRALRVPPPFVVPRDVLGPFNGPLPIFDAMDPEERKELDEAWGEFQYGCNQPLIETGDQDLQRFLSDEPRFVAAWLPPLPAGPPMRGASPDIATEIDRLYGR